METLNAPNTKVHVAAASQPARPIWLIILTVSLPMFMASLDNLIVTNALPVIGKELEATFEQLSWFSMHTPSLSPLWSSCRLG